MCPETMRGKKHTRITDNKNSASPEQMGNAALLFFQMPTLLPAPRPALPWFLQHLSDSKTTLGVQRSGQSPTGSAIGAARRDF